MKKILTIKLNADFNYFSYTILNDTDRIDLMLDANDNLNDVKIKQKIESSIVDHIKYLEELEDIIESDKEITILKEHLNKKINIFDGIEYIYFDCDIRDIKYFLVNNKQLKQEKIALIVSENYDISELKEIIEEFKEWDNIYISISLDEEPIKLHNYIKSTLYVNEFVTNIKKLKLSPLEEMMIIYSTISNKTLTRDNSTTRGNEIISTNLSAKEICSLYEDLLNKLKYKYITCDCYIDNNFYNKICYGIYINDSKYGIDGIYYFSPVLETLMNNNTSNQSFNFFAQTTYDFENNSELDIKLDKKLDDELIYQFLNLVSTGGLISIGSDIYSSINTISDLILGERIIPPEYKNRESYKLFPDSLKKKIDLNVIIRDVINFKDKLTTPINQSILLHLFDNMFDIYDKSSGTETNCLSFFGTVTNFDCGINKIGDMEIKKYFMENFHKVLF